MSIKWVTSSCSAVSIQLKWLEDAEMQGTENMQLVLKSNILKQIASYDSNLN